MKKQYTFLVLGLCAGLLTTACSDDDYTNDFTRPAGGNRFSSIVSHNWMKIIR